MIVTVARRLFYPVGYCAIGCTLPNAIGAKLARPEEPVIVLAGDCGFMFIVQWRLVALEPGPILPVIVRENGDFRQIQDDKDVRDIDPVDVEGGNPDFLMLANTFGCHDVRPDCVAVFKSAETDALVSDKPAL